MYNYYNYIVILIIINMFYVYNSNKINILCINYVFFIKKKNSVSCPVKTIFLVLFFIQMSGRFFFENFKYRYMSVNPEKASRTLRVVEISNKITSKIFDIFQKQLWNFAKKNEKLNCIYEWDWNKIISSLFLDHFLTDGNVR